VKGLFNKIFSKGNELDKILEKAGDDNLKRFLVVWNRGLGDIALGLYAFMLRVRSFIPDAEITFITRKELEEAFLLLEGAMVITVPWWERGRPVNIERVVEDFNLASKFDVIFDNLNPTKWLVWQIGKVTPRLKWKAEYDRHWRRFFNEPSGIYIGVHLNTETQQFYGYRKDWPVENWKRLFESLSNKPDIRIILFGLNKKEPFNLPSVIDLRGETTLLEMLSIIKNCCNILIAPDGGVLSITYYLDVYFPITVISLWGDPNQGVLKQAVPSPNPGLVHIPLIGAGKDVSRISVDEVYGHVENSLQKKIL